MRTKMTNTIDYYNNNAKAFNDSTVGVDFYEMQDKFLGNISGGKKILDFGCGSGRDTKYFLSKGYDVDATDGSIKMCSLASELTGIEVKQMMFDELSAVDKYDGIWACSSILHLNKVDLKDVMIKMAAAVKDTGIIYTSFKYGDFSGERNGRFFTDFTAESFRNFIKDIPILEIREEWITGDVRPGRGNEKWLNLIIQKRR